MQTRQGMIRKPPGPTFLGSILEDSYVEFEDIRLEVEGLGRDVRMLNCTGGWERA